MPLRLPSHALPTRRPRMTPRLYQLLAQRLAEELALMPSYAKSPQTLRDEEIVKQVARSGLIPWFGDQPALAVAPLDDSATEDATDSGPYD